jgi:hypothetical protein
MSRLIAALFLLLSVRPDALVGQTAAPAASLRPGARVRIATRDDTKPRVTTVVAQKGDTLLVRSPEFNILTLPLDEISQLEVSTGRHRNVVKGMVLGTGIGGTVGGLLGAVTYQPCESTEFMGCFLAPKDRQESAVVGGVVGGVLGFVIGSLAGLARHDDWKQVPLDARRVTVNVAPRAHGAGLGVALEF